MEDKEKLMESLLEKATDYGKTSLELLKLKALDKTSDVASSFVPHSFVFLMIASFMFFINLGIAYWLGEILGRTWSGFFIVAGFYGLIGIIVHFFFHKRIKNAICTYIIQQISK